MRLGNVDPKNDKVWNVMVLLILTTLYNTCHDMYGVLYSPFNCDMKSTMTAGNSAQRVS